VNSYFDTSALVKLYLSEDGSTVVRKAATNATEAATSSITYVEARSAFSRKLRMREITPRQFERHKAEFERDWQHFTRFDLDSHIIAGAAELIEKFPLKAYDAIHLSAALSMRQATRLRVSFVCFDQGLCAAARELEFDVVGPT
jgi:uncharacterized protein